MRIEILGGIAKGNGNGPSGGPGLILEGFRESTLQFGTEPSAVWKQKTSYMVLSSFTW